MPQEDYIKREIDKLGKVLAKVLAGLLGLKSEGKLSDGIAVTNQSLKAELDFDLDTLLALPENELLPFLAGTKKLSNVQMELIADLLFESADESSAHYLSRYSCALAIYEALRDNELTYSISRHYRIELIRQAISERSGS